MKGKGIVKNGILIPDNKNLYKNLLTSLENSTIVWEIKKFRNIRSISQNKYYWWILNFISAEFGDIQENYHEFFKTKFLALKIELLGCETMSYVSTASLNTKQFTEYIEKIRQFMSLEMDFYIPQADEMGDIY